MPSWRPATASEPDEGDEWRFQPLSEVDPDCEKRLLEHFAPRFLEDAALPTHHLAEVPDTVSLVVADEWDPPDGTKRLRMTSWYTGETRWLHDWNGKAETALDWMDDCADVFGGWVHAERGYGTTTRWDE